MSDNIFLIVGCLMTGIVAGLFICTIICETYDKNINTEFCKITHNSVQEYLDCTKHNLHENIINYAKKKEQNN